MLWVKSHDDDQRIFINKNGFGEEEITILWKHTNNQRNVQQTHAILCFEFCSAALRSNQKFPRQSSSRYHQQRIVLIMNLFLFLTLSSMFLSRLRCTLMHPDINEVPSGSVFMGTISFVLLNAERPWEVDLESNLLVRLVGGLVYRLSNLCVLRRCRN